MRTTKARGTVAREKSCRNADSRNRLMKCRTTMFRIPLCTHKHQDTIRHRARTATMTHSWRAEGWNLPHIRGEKCRNKGFRKMGPTCDRVSISTIWKDVCALATDIFPEVQDTVRHLLAEVLEPEGRAVGDAVVGQCLRLIDERGRLLAVDRERKPLPVPHKLEQVSYRSYDAGVRPNGSKCCQA